MMDFNKVFDEVGEFGPYQCVMCVILASCMLPGVLSSFNVVFIMGVTDYWCHIPHVMGLNSSIEDIKNVTLPLETEQEGETAGYSQCNMYDRNYTGWAEEDVEEYLLLGNHDNASSVKCLYGWEYDTTVYGETATTQWNLVCDMRWWQAAAASFFAFGMFSSLLIYGTLADLLGRKPLLCWSYILFIVSNLLTGFATNHQFLIATRFFSGFFSTPFYGGTFVLVCELVGPTWRGHVNAWYGYFWSLGGIVMAGMAFAIKDWKILQFSITGVMFLNLVFFIVPESPRWLYIKGKQKEANKIFQRIARSNKRQFNPEKLLSCDSRELKDSNGYLWDMFRTRSLSLRSCVTFCNWFSASLCYYGLTLNSTSLGGNEYLNFVLSMLVEVPGIILCHIIAVKVGRRWPLVCSMLFSALFLLLTLLFEQGSASVITLVSLGKMTCTLAFNLLYVYVVELYPTVIRSIASCAGNFIARLGSILAPFIAQLSDFQSSLPMMIFGVCSLAAGLLAILLPETIGINLEDSLSTNEQRKDVNPEENKLKTDDVTEEISNGKIEEVTTM